MSIGKTWYDIDLKYGVRVEVLESLHDTNKYWNMDTKKKKIDWRNFHGQFCLSIFKFILFINWAS